MESSKIGALVKTAEQLFAESWKRLRTEAPAKYAAVAELDFKVVVNSGEKFCKHGLLSSPTMMQAASALKVAPSGLAKEFVRAADEVIAASQAKGEHAFDCIGTVWEWVGVKRVSQSQGYVNVEVFGQNTLLAETEEKKGQFDPVTSLYSTVVYDAHKDPTFLVKPIGRVESCFREKFGTPRQGTPPRKSEG